MIDVEVWVRGRQDATTERITGIENDPMAWTDEDVRLLLEGMLLALQRTSDPKSEPPPVTLRGFSWIVSAVPEGGVLLHVEMQLGTVSAGPFAMQEDRLTDMVSRVIGGPKVSTLVH